MKKLMSLREYARHRKVSLSAVQKALISERISFVIDSEGRKRIDHLVADREWTAHTNPAMVRDKDQPVSEARTMREFYEAKLAKLEYEKRIGKLIDSGKVRQNAFALARRLRDRLLNIPDRISAELVGISDQTDHPPKNKPN